VALFGEAENAKNQAALAQARTGGIRREWL
jgi:hypothetical protein